MSTFLFKQFSIRQTNAAMKVGTDAMLLGSLCRFEKGGQLLDIGTGTGVLSLMTAQRFRPEAVTAIEIDTQAAEDALHNFSQSAFPTTFRLIRENVLQWDPEQLFDGIITNPPYFEHSSKSHSAQRNLARHTDALPFPALMHWCTRFLSPNGYLWMIVPTDAEPILLAAGAENGLFPQEIISIHGKPGTTVRSILCFGKSVVEVSRSVFTVRNANGTYTAAYIGLTRDFHHTDLSLQSR